MKPVKHTFFLTFLSFLLSCSESSLKEHDAYLEPISFTKVENDISGFNFKNLLDENTLKNPFNYINAYNGGGVAIGDVNNDGLQDIYMTGNMTSSRLYLNQGNMKFKDVSTRAGVKTNGWCTGATMADVNNDGWLDIYVCRSYEDQAEQRMNLLFINDKKGGFKEQARKYGLNDPNLSIAASFFDYDHDGDMDIIVANHPRFRLISFKKHYEYFQNPPKELSSKLFRNEGDGTFTDVTESSGVLSYGFSLGVITSDLDNDGWSDIYISVDHDEPDIIFHNNGDGTFTNIINSAMKSHTRSSMGLDAGDLNADPYPEIIVAEMLSEDHYREKSSMSMQTVKRFEFITDSLKYKYYQMRNYLHLNNGNNTFSDIGQISGIHKTDWSWSTLFMDANNDGRQDLFIANGYYRNIYERDRKSEFDKVMMSISPQDMDKRNRTASEYARNCTQTRLQNYFFKNNGEFDFNNVAASSGLDELTISTGAAYGDLDNDGDLDLVVNNLGQTSSLYLNNADRKNNFLRVRFMHNMKCQPYGAKAIIEYEGKKQYRELLSSRGYQSFSEPFIHFGLGTAQGIDKLTVIWPTGEAQIFENIEPNTTLEVSFENAKDRFTPLQEEKIVEEIPTEISGIDFDQREIDYHDYQDQVLLPHKLSELGPHISKGDVNGDGREDLFIGAPKGQAAGLFVQLPNGNFEAVKDVAFEKDKGYEDMHSSFFDADSDNDLDLLVASGSYEFDKDSPLFQPRLYLNDGSGSFKRSSAAIPTWRHASSCVKVEDIDKDGDLDLFIGGRLSPKRYPEPGTSAIFLNDGSGNFKEVIDEVAPGLKNIGMVTDAIWHDVNLDGEKDLVVVGEWMPISIWINEEGMFQDRTSTYQTDTLTGWWNCIYKEDLDADGYDDLVFGNLGLNYKYTASQEKPFIIYGKDFDNSGTCDIALASYYGDKLYPVRGRSCSSEQMPLIAEKFETFEEYANADFDAVYGELVEDSYHYKVKEFSSLILYGNASGEFELSKLPKRCQLSPINDVVSTDLNSDGKIDLIVGGNMHQSEIETGQADAGTGVVLLNKGDRKWDALEVHESGLYIAGDLKSLELVDLANGSQLLVTGNNLGKTQTIKVK
ncbi:MAG: VCBS repeat-containing protein [Saprospiraceae bacterium]|nr:VCBS repeat-containing protein [Saprospiraceae bacterium]